MYYLGDCYVLRNDLNNAKQWLHKALALQPDFELAYVDLGVIAQREGNWSEAAKDFERAVKLSPNYTEVYFMLGHVYQKLNEPQKAKNVFDKGTLLRGRNSQSQMQP
jgi:uncharacterized protein HemY